MPVGFSGMDAELLHPKSLPCSPDFCIYRSNKFGDMTWITLHSLINEALT